MVFAGRYLYPIEFLCTVSEDHSGLRGRSRDTPGQAAPSSGFHKAVSLIELKPTLMSGQGFRWRETSLPSPLLPNSRDETCQWQSQGPGDLESAPAGLFLGAFPCCSLLAAGTSRAFLIFVREHGPL